jgi:hypothetical protein
VGQNEIEISHLQFANDTLIMGESSWSNIWAVKAIFNFFELMSALKVNYHKSVLVSFNNTIQWMNGAASALNCKSGSYPFIDLGLPIGGDHRKKLFGRLSLRG